MTTLFDLYLIGAEVLKPGRYAFFSRDNYGNPCGCVLGCVLYGAAREGLVPASPDDLVRYFGKSEGIAGMEEAASWLFKNFTQNEFMQLSSVNATYSRTYAARVLEGLHGEVR